MSPSALIFDVDGTLAESEEAHRQALNQTFAAWSLGWHWDQATYRRLLKVTSGKERMRAYQTELPKAAQHLSIDDIAALHLEKTRAYSQLVRQGKVALRPGVADLIERARAAGMVLAVATTTNLPNVEALCESGWGHNGRGQAAEQVFDTIAAGDMVIEKKPAPHVYRLALAQLGAHLNLPGPLPAAQALAFEDSHNGLVSAQTAGLSVVVTPSLYTQDEDFSGADLVLPSLQNFDLGALDLGRG